MSKPIVSMDATILSSLQVCELKFDLRHNLNVVPIKWSKKSIEMGSTVHIILAEFYRNIRAGSSRSEAIVKAIEAGDDYFVHGEVISPATETTPEVREALTDVEPEDYSLILNTMEKYFKFRENDAFTILEVEHVKGKVIYEDEEIRLLWKAKFDIIADFPDGVKSIDHKTMKRQFTQLNLNNQFMGQCLLLNSRNIIINKIGFQTSLKPEERFARQMISYSAEQLVEFAEIAGYYAKYLIALNENKYFPPRYTSCRTGFGVCEYHENFCGVNRSMRTENLREHFKMGKVWDIENV